MGSVCILWRRVKNKPCTSAAKIMAIGFFAPCRDGEQIENEEDEKYIFSDDSSELTIRKVDKSDEAEYVCIAENKAGEQDASIHLKVFGKDGGGQGHCSATVPLTRSGQQQDPILSALESVPAATTFASSTP